jgi:hypothetical protein
MEEILQTVPTPKEEMKPLGQKAYGSIPHLPNSRLGSGDHSCDPGYATIALKRPRDNGDLIIVQEKLDGSNVAVAKVNGEIISVNRSGYTAESSPYDQHKYFAKWVEKEKSRFDRLLNEGERVCGEWLMQAHGTRYNLPHEPFVPFDIMKKSERMTYHNFLLRVLPLGFTVPRLLSIGSSFPLDKALDLLKESGHGAIDEVEGAIWRVERDGKVDFLTKYVKHDKEDGKFLPEINGGETFWNVEPISIGLI